MRDKPYQVIDVLTDATVEWMETYVAAQQKYPSGYSILYRPGRKTKVKRKTITKTVAEQIAEKQAEQTERRKKLFG